MKHIIKFSIVSAVFSAALLAIALLIDSRESVFISAFVFIGFLLTTPFLIRDALKDKYDSSSPRYMKGLKLYVFAVSVCVSFVYAVALFFPCKFFSLPILDVMPLLYPFVLLMVIFEYSIVSNAYLGIDNYFSRLIRRLTDSPIYGLCIVFAIGLTVFLVSSLLMLTLAGEFLLFVGMLSPGAVSVYCVTFLSAYIGYRLIGKADNKCSFALKYFSLFAGVILVLAGVSVLLAAAEFRYPYSHISGLYWIDDISRKIKINVACLAALPLVTVATSLLLGALSGRKKKEKA